MRLEGERVVLRRLTAADVPPLAKIAAEPAVRRRWVEAPVGELEARAVRSDEATFLVIELDGVVTGLARCYENDDPAFRCYEKVGFSAVGVARSYWRDAQGRLHDALLMDMLADGLT